VNTDTGEVTDPLAPGSITEVDDDAAEQQYREMLQAAEEALDTRTYEAMKPTIKGYYRLKFANQTPEDVDNIVEAALKKHLPSTAYKIRDVKEGRTHRDVLALAIVEGRFDLNTGNIKPAAAQPAAGG
jgi:hypothetical protein